MSSNESNGGAASGGRSVLRTLAPLALIVLSIVLYFVLSTQFGLYQRYPVPHILLAFAGVAWLTLDLRRHGGWLRGLALAFGLFLAASYTWYTLDFSTYDARDHGVRTGQAVAGLTSLSLVDHDGQPTSVLANTQRATLLVFYRGFW